MERPLPGRPLGTKAHRLTPICLTGAPSHRAPPSKRAPPSLQGGLDEEEDDSFWASTHGKGSERLGRAS